MLLVAHIYFSTWKSSSYARLHMGAKPHTTSAKPSQVAGDRRTDSMQCNAMHSQRERETRIHPVVIKEARKSSWCLESSLSGPSSSSSFRAMDYIRQRTRRRSNCYQHTSSRETRAQMKSVCSHRCQKRRTTTRKKFKTKESPREN